MTKRIFSSIVALALVFAMAAPVSAETTVGNVGNGVDTKNTTSVNQSNTTTVSQNNAAEISNNISVKSNTGGNNASRNTGGDVIVDTGSSKATVVVENVANRNAASVDNCCVGNDDVTVRNEGNGDSSSNKAYLNQQNATGLFQNNSAAFNNNVNVDSNTGNNKALSNTGGDVVVNTGASDVGVGISNAANENRAVLGGRTHSGSNGSLTLVNGANGVDTYNKVSGNFTNSTLALQNNAATISNNVGIKTNTGYNQASRNTGGDVFIDTGASDITALLDNRANFNAASLDNCGCVGFGDTKVANAGNGDSAKSYASLNKENVSEAFQNNASAINNYGKIYDNTGKNTANSNTGAYGYYSDPAIFTGNSDVVVSADTAANENVLNSGHVHMPTNPTMGGNTSGNGAWWMAWGWNSWMI